MVGIRCKFFKDIDFYYVKYSVSKFYILCYVVSYHKYIKKLKIRLIFDKLRAFSLNLSYHDFFRIIFVYLYININFII